MGCTDTVSTVGSVPGRRVAPEEETQNRVARWEACRCTKRNTHAFKSTARSNTRSHSRLQIQGVLLGEGTVWHLLRPHIQGPFSSLLINQAAWIAIQIPYALLLLLFLASTNVFFLLYFGYLQISHLVLSPHGRCHAVTKHITFLIGRRA